MVCCRRCIANDALLLRVVEQVEEDDVVLVEEVQPVAGGDHLQAGLASGQLHLVEETRELLQLCCFSAG